MQRLPAIPLHAHVWEVALQQLANGARLALNFLPHKSESLILILLNSLSAIQSQNRTLFQNKFYRGQATLNPATANIRYFFLASDSSRLYRMYNRFKGVDFAELPEYNLDNWLNSSNPKYDQELHNAIFYYQARTEKSERLRVCIQTDEMRAAAWKYAHNGQLILDGTFGVSDTRLLLFIALGINETGKGVPLTFFLFSAPTGNQATHAGYDSAILTEVLQAWVTAMGFQDGKPFAPKLVMTDTDLKERAALHLVWPFVMLLLCKFHIRTCWANRRKTLIKMRNEKLQFNFHKKQVYNRIVNLEQR
ncbi:MAG TPA: hypothetical protein VGO47_13865 [Chlamydiales bacterium]|nr:hypothetical protein [Chlamydiales bacterium]